MKITASERIAEIERALEPKFRERVFGGVEAVVDKSALKIAAVIAYLDEGEDQPRILRSVPPPPREPTIEEIAKTLGVPASDLREMVERSRAARERADK